MAQNALAQRAVVGLTKMTIVYIGLENPIDVAVDGVKAKDLIVQINGGELKGENGKYIYVPDGSNRLAVLKVGYKKRNKVKWVDSVEYRVRQVPRPEVLFGIKSGGAISKGELMTVSQINAGLGEGFAMEGIRYRVKSYRITVAGESVFYSETVNGNKITDKSRKIFRHLKSGDNVIVDNVMAEREDYQLKLNVLYLTVKSVSQSRDYIFSFIDSFGKRQIFNLEDDEFINSFDFSNKFLKDSLWQISIEETGVPVHQSFYKNDSLLWIKTYYTTGKIKMIKYFNYSNSTGTYIDYYDNGSIYKNGLFLMKDKNHLIVDSECSFDKILNQKQACDLIYIDECLYGNWKVNYPNGKVKEEGFMDTTTRNTYIYDLYKDSDKVVFSVRHGLWKFYDEKGKLIRQTVYNKGHIKED
ncbi:MAG: GldM family protein [Bacteroidia bacterium]